MLVSLFTYGTLMVPEIIQSLLGRQPKAEPAYLNGFERHLVMNANYPGIRPQLNGCVSGLVYFQISQNELDILNAFEGDMYEVLAVTATLISGESIPTCTYVVKEQFENLLTDKDWSLEKFNSLHKDNFIREYHGFTQS